MAKDHADGQFWEWDIWSGRELLHSDLGLFVIIRGYGDTDIRIDPVLRGCIRIIVAVGDDSNEGMDSVTRDSIGYQDANGDLRSDRRIHLVQDSIRFHQEREQRSYRCRHVVLLSHRHLYVIRSGAVRYDIDIIVPPHCTIAT